VKRASACRCANASSGVRAAWAAGIAGLLLAGCASGAPSEAAGWRGLKLSAADRVLSAALPAPQQSGPIVTVFIEGDGRSHDRGGRPSGDPTPRRPIAFEIAQAWPTGPVAWLGRLCQYVRRIDPKCREADWTTGRFSAEAVTASDAAVDELKAAAGADQVVLVGWSGGGVLAALLAGRRDDVAGLITIAAPLDLAAWTAFHGLSDLAGSLDPARSEPLALPQAHIFGSRDPVTPPQTALEAARRLAAGGGRVEVWPQAHDCCWAAEAGRLAGLLGP